MQDTIMAYTAGLIDGEGCISLQYSSRNTIQPYCRIAMTNRDVIDWFAGTFGGNVTTKAAGEKCEEAFAWQMSSKPKLSLFLTELFPFLKVKRVHALIVIDFCSKFPNTINGVRYSKADLVLMRQYFQVIGIANSVGPGSNKAKAKLFSVLLSEVAK